MELGLYWLVGLAVLFLFGLNGVAMAALWRDRFLPPWTEGGANLGGMGGACVGVLVVVHLLAPEVAEPLVRRWLPLPGFLFGSSPRLAGKSTDEGGLISYGPSFNRDNSLPSLDGDGGEGY